MIPAAAYGAFAPPRSSNKDASKSLKRPRDTGVVETPREKLPAPRVELIVSVVDSLLWPEITEIAKSWKTLSKELIKSGSRDPRIPDLKDRCQTISQMPTKPNKDYSVLVCQTTDRNILAIAVYFCRDNHLVHIISHPQNLIASKRIKGPATAIMLTLAKFTLTADLPLTARISPSSAGFFRDKLQFEEAAEYTKREDAEAGRPVLKLTKEKIRSLITAKVHPFNQLTLS